MSIPIEPVRLFLLGSVLIRSVYAGKDMAFRLFLQNILHFFSPMLAIFRFLI